MALDSYVRGLAVLTVVLMIGAPVAGATTPVETRTDHPRSGELGTDRPADALDRSAVTKPATNRSDLSVGLELEQRATVERTGDVTVTTYANNRETDPIDGLTVELLVDTDADGRFESDEVSASRVTDLDGEEYRQVDLVYENVQLDAGTYRYQSRARKDGRAATSYTNGTLQVNDADDDLQIGLELEQEGRVDQGGNVTITTYPTNQASTPLDNVTVELRIDIDDDSRFAADEVRATQKIDLNASQSGRLDMVYRDVQLSNGSYQYQTRARKDGRTVTSYTNGTLQVNGTNVPPNASFVVSPSNPDIGETIRLDASAAGDADGEITSYQWDLNDDGNTDVTRVTPVHNVTYATVGAKPITLVVEDDDGATDSANETVQVGEGDDSDAPSATQNWPTKGFDDRNTGYNPNALAPTANPAVDWRFNISIDNVGGGIKNGGPGFIDRSAPAVVNGTVYVGDSGHGIAPKYLYAVDAANGSLVWRQGRSFNGDWASAPTVANGVVYAGNEDGKLDGVDVSSGTSIQNFPLSVGTGTASDAVESPTVANGDVYFGSDLSEFYSYDASTGAVNWVFDLGNDNNRITAAPAVHDGTVYVATRGRGTQRVYAVDTQTGQEVWNRTLGDAGNAPGGGSQVSVRDGTVYLGTSGLSGEPAGQDVDVYAYNATDGSTEWVRSLGSDRVGASKTGVAVAGGGVFVGTASGTLYALDGSSGTTVWNVQFPGSISTQPSIANGMVYLGDDSGQVHAINASTGVRAWAYPTGSGVAASVTPAGSGLYVAAGDRLYRFTGDVEDNRDESLLQLTRAPSASLSMRPTEPTVGRSVTFNASNSTDDGTIVEYQWDFDGDGEIDRTTASPTVTYAYQTNGSVTARVTVVDDDGQTATAEQTVDVVTTEEAGAVVALSPTTATVSSGGSQTFDVQVSNVDRGVGTIAVEVRVADDRTGAVQGGAVSIAFSRGSVSGNGSVTTLEGESGNTNDTGPVTVGEVTVGGLRPGSTAIDLTVRTLQSEDSTNYTVASTSGANLTVTETSGRAPAPAPDATDPDGDGIYEDINGDERVTAADVTAAFNLVVSGESDPALDINGAGDGLTTADITALFNAVVDGRVP